MEIPIVVYNAGRRKVVGMGSVKSDDIGLVAECVITDKDTIAKLMSPEEYKHYSTPEVNILCSVAKPGGWGSQHTCQFVAGHEPGRHSWVVDV